MRYKEETIAKNAVIKIIKAGVKLLKIFLLGQSAGFKDMGLNFFHCGPHHHDSVTAF